MAKQKKKAVPSVTDIFIGYRVYVAYMETMHPNASKLSYRDWLDYGHKQ